MGLFDFLKKSNGSDTVKVKDKDVDFKDIIIESFDVEKDLKKISNKYHIDVKELDFTIISYRTLYKKNTKNNKYKILKDIDAEEILSKENLLNPDFTLKQQYKLNVFKKNSSNSNFPIKIQLGANQDFTKIYATFKKNSSVDYHNMLENDILNQINKKKIRQGIFIGIFEDELKENIKKVTSHIMINKSIKEDMKFLVCSGIERYMESKEYVNLIFQEKKAEENKNISLKDQTNLATVKKGDIVLEVIKGQKGQDGRNCKGEFLPKNISHHDTTLKYEDIEIGDGLEERDEGEKIVYIAKKDGYVLQNGSFFDISDDIVVDQINIKTTGSIRAGDKDIKVHVENHDETMDAIGSGVVLDTKEVKTKGNVANNAKITADIVEINGQTHQSSIIKGKKVKIHLHRGYAEGDKVDIGTLEGGKIVADEVYVDTLSGGEIKAKKIFINRLISNANLYASELIEISVVDGNSNFLYIDPKAQRDFDKIVSNLENEINDIEFQIKKNTHDLKILKRKIMSDKDAVEEIKKRILEIKAQNQKPPQAMINKIKEDKANKLEFNNTVKLLKDLKARRDELKDKITNFNESIFDARVVVNSPWKEYNEVIFRVVEPKKEIKRAMGEREIANSLGLKVTKDNEYIIANLD